MIKPILYIFEDGELDQIIDDIPSIKKYIKKYESNTKETTTQVGRAGRETPSTSTDYQGCGE